ncbi:sialidase family protein [Chryseobacterium populi]|uniref:Sialidase domain-containing protein n=1 Tax=Chryseobacterium populi TaxID=1144316 RepID=J3CMW2_9FLAO|nr:sialidase family protein [Chryseobacterium populi]EJL74904.1 hypothetical protein PMI13_00784 [Chryseobacterium populi]
MKTVINCIIILGYVLMFQQKVYGQQKVKIVDYKISAKQPEFYNAIYTSTKGNDLRSRNLISADNGLSWIEKATNTKGIALPPKYGRRVPVTSVYDTNQNLFVTFFNALDNPNVSSKIAEPKEALKDYYIRYRVSNDNGKSWLSDEPIVIQGNNYSGKNPLPLVTVGENAYYLGDTGSRAIITSNGTILLPAQKTVKASQKDNKLNKNQLYNPNGGYTYTEAIILQGSWENQKIIWKNVSAIKGDPNKTTRGLIEPTIVELSNGYILSIMRGSNGGDKDKSFLLPSYKWMSYSSDNGKAWSQPEPWTYNDGTNFYSPSSMSILYKHTNGRVFWIGNINENNSKGAQNRYPLVIGEVDQKSMKLIKSSVILLDDLKTTDKGKGELDLGHVTIIEDKNTKELIIVYPRIFGNSKQREWATIRLSVK